MIQNSKIKHDWTRRYRVLLAMALCIATLTLTGCRQHYPGIEYDGLEDDIGVEYLNADVPIMVAVNDPLYVHYTTRGVGAFEDYVYDENTGSTYYEDKKWEGADFRIYAFLRRNYYYDGDIDYTKTANYKNAEDYYCLIDDAGDIGANGHGRRAHLTKDNGSLTSFLEWKNDDGSIKYNNTYQNYAYHFFAYYLDDAYEFINGPTYREKDYIAYDFTIDGTQDLMCGYASLTSDQIRKVEEMGKNGQVSVQFADQIKELAFSKQTGNRDIHPVFDMKHKLAFLEFQLKAGEVNGKPDEMAYDVRIKNISIEAKTKGTMVVAANDTSKVGVTFEPNSMETLYMATTKMISLNDVSDGGKQYGDTLYIIGDSAMVVVPGEFEGFETPIEPRMGGESETIGMGFLVPPADEYALTLDCYQIKEGGDLIPYKVNYRIKPGNGEPFKEGYKYTVKVSVFGHQKIQIQLGTVTWEDGGDIDLDDEDDGEWEY